MSSCWKRGSSSSRRLATLCLAIVPVSAKGEVRGGGVGSRRRQNARSGLRRRRGQRKAVQCAGSHSELSEGRRPRGSGPPGLREGGLVARFCAGRQASCSRCSLGEQTCLDSSKPCDTAEHELGRAGQRAQDSASLEGNEARGPPLQPISHPSALALPFRVPASTSRDPQPVQWRRSPAPGPPRRPPAAHQP